MATIDRITQLQQQGFQEQEIIEQLKKENYPIKEINEGLNQSRIKSAVYQEQSYPQQDSGMEQSILQQNPPSAEQEQELTPPQAEQYPEYQQPAEGYPADAYYPEQSSYGVDTITEIAEQIVTEKFRKINEQIGDIPIFKERMTSKLNELDSRLKSIENSIESLQQAIIGKIKDFGDSNKVVHKDLENLHDTMSKMMNPLIDNYNELKKLNSKK